MLHDFKELMPNVEITGVDISEYAIKNAKESVKDSLQIGNAKELPFDDNSFDFVCCINTVHNLPLPECKQAISEIERVSKGNSFITMDAWRNEKERESLLKWNLTALSYMHVDEWKKLFADIGYTGDYYWFLAI
jgi:ubiquinone/menaquinone biosynthesis C-methylase UbiE